MKTQQISIDLFGKDHWSTLAYIETVIVENTFYELKSDSHMRTHSHHKNLLGKHQQMFGMGTGDKYGTRLNNGEEIFHHDDWDCIFDAEKEKIVKIENNKVKFTDYGYSILAQLRKHKSEGGSFSDFKIK